MYTSRNSPLLKEIKVLFNSRIYVAARQILNKDAGADVPFGVEWETPADATVAFLSCFFHGHAWLREAPKWEKLAQAHKELT